MLANKKFVKIVFLFFQSFLNAMQPPSAQLQSANIDWKKGLHVTLAYFIGDNQENSLAIDNLNQFKSEHPEFMLNLPLGDLDLLTTFEVSSEPIFSMKGGITKKIKNYERLIDQNPPSNDDPWYIVMRFSDQNYQDINPYDKYMTRYFEDRQKIVRSFFPHVTIGIIKEIPDSELFLKTFLKANKKFVEYLSNINPKIRFDPFHLSIGPSYFTKRSPYEWRFILSNSIGKQSKVFASYIKTAQLLKEAEVELLAQQEPEFPTLPEKPLFQPPLCPVIPKVEKPTPQPTINYLLEQQLRNLVDTLTELLSLLVT